MLRPSLVGCAVLAVLLHFSLGGVSWAEPLARLHRSGDVLEWLPQIEPEQLELRLAGPDGTVRSWQFPAGSVPSLSLFDAGQPLPDGLYTYELRARSLVQAGTFRIRGGEVLTGDKGERAGGSRPKDQRIPDDLIVDGKGCIGLACINGESFGAETLRLKQSVVRLRFEDTSTGAFPSRDWQLTVNDPGTGGADRFSIEDLTAGRTPLTIRGNAPDNALVIDGSGKLGLRTATPESQLHVRGADPAVANTKVLVENAATTTNFRELFEIRNNGGAAFIVEDTSVPERWSFVGFTNFVMDNQANAGLELNLGPTGNLTILGALTQNSDRAAKESLAAVAPKEVLAKVADLPLFTWNYLRDPSKAPHLGPMAQDFRAAFGLGEDERHIAPSDLAGVSLAAIQALNAELEVQQRTIEQQQELIRQLAERLARLEAKP